ncbi:MAG: hypothetical protein ACKON9_23180, partial [Planctomycetaceae bacterium]
SAFGLPGDGRTGWGAATIEGHRITPPRQLSPFSDSQSAARYHPSGPRSSFGNNDICLRGDGKVSMVAGFHTATRVAGLTD